MNEIGAAIQADTACVEALCHRAQLARGVALNGDVCRLRFHVIALFADIFGAARQHRVGRR